MATVNEIANLLNGLSDDELRTLNRILIEKLNTRRAIVQEKAKAQFYTGQSVGFTDTKRGRKVVATIEKINMKNIKCREKRDGLPDMVWTVTPSLLKPVA